MRITLIRTERGLPAFWENGGGMTSSGSAQVIGGNHGQKKTAIFVNNNGNLACKNHALFIVHTGDIIVDVARRINDTTIRVLRVTGITDDETDATVAYAETAVIHRYENARWDTMPSSELDDILDAAQNKATCYHCREMSYGKVAERRGFP